MVARESQQQESNTMSDTFYCNTCEREVDVEYIHVHNGHSKQ
jgi:hypothetical protein